MTASSVKIYKIVCILIILIVAAIRLHLSGIAFERDEGEYAYAGQLILQGHPPYQGIYNMKYPGTYYMYALSFKLFGEGVKAPRYMVMLLQLSSAWFLFLLVRSMVHRMAGWLCAATFLLFNLSIAMQGLQSNAEQFLVAFLIPSLYFLNRGIERESLMDVFWAGVLISFASIMKQHAVVFAAASLLWIAYNKRAEMPRYVLVYLAGVALPLLLLFSYLWYKGVWGHFYFLAFQYARAYVGLSPAPHIGLDTLLAIYRKEPVIVGGTIVSIAGLLFQSVNLRARPFIILFLLASVLALSLGFYFRPHYFLYLVPVISILFSYSAFRFTSYFTDPLRFMVLAISLGLMAFSFLYTNRACFFLMTDEDVTELVYPGTPFNACREIASYIRNNTEPGDRICMVGVEPQIFFLSQRHSASGYIYVYPLLESQKYAVQMTDEFIAQSEQSKPAILLYSSKSVFEDGANQNTRLYRWFVQFKSNYKLVALCYAQNDQSRMNVFDTITPVDTFSVTMPQIKVYKRIGYN